MEASWGKASFAILFNLQAGGIHTTDSEYKNETLPISSLFIFDSAFTLVFIYTSGHSFLRSALSCSQWIRSESREYWVWKGNAPMGCWRIASHNSHKCAHEFRGDLAQPIHLPAYFFGKRIQARTRGEPGNLRRASSSGLNQGPRSYLMDHESLLIQNTNIIFGRILFLTLH